MDVFFPEVDANQRATALGLDILPASFGEGWRAAFEETLTRNPLPSILRSTERARYREGRYVDEFGNEQVAPAVPSTILSPEEANAKYGIKGYLTFSTPTPEPVAEEIRQTRMREVELQDIRRRANSGIGTALSAGLVGSLLDPLNIASAFIPVIGPARMAAMTAQVGAGTARVVKGAAEGVVGAAVLEPAVLYTAREESADYTAVDSLANLAFGAAIGGGLHWGVGKVSDRIEARAQAADAAYLKSAVDSEASGLMNMIEHLSRPEQSALLRTAVVQLAEGRPVNVASVLAATEPVLTRAARLAEAQVRLSELAEIPAFLRTAEDILAFRNATEAATVPAKLSSEMKRAVEILKQPGFLRSPEDRIFLAGLQDAAVIPEHRARAEALLAKMEEGKAPADFKEAAQMALVRAGKEAVLRKIDDATQLATGPEERARATEAVVRDIASGAYDREFAVDLRSTDAQGRAFQTALAEREAALRADVQKAQEPHVDPVDQRGEAAAEARVAEEANVKTLDDEAARIQEEVTELEKYMPEGTEPGQAVKDAAKEANLFAKAWQAAAACGMRKA